MGESLFPKATDATFAEKLMTNLLGKWTQFAKPNPRPDPDAHFAVIHYAATVSYNLTGWLEKNKDPLNDTIVELIKNGGNTLAIECFKDHPGQPAEAPKNEERKKGKGGKTVSSYFKGQLDDLMTTLYKTEPHFIRCVVPNTHKQPGGVEPGLVMHQYQCNGVLAGIAICRAGFPNKLAYPEFKERYNILAAAAVARAKKDKDAAGAVMKTVLALSCLGCKPKPEEKPLVSSSRSCKIKNWLSTASKEPFVTTTLVRLGFGGNCGWPSSLTSNVPSLLNTRLSMKRRLPLLKPILTRPLLNATKSRLCMRGSVLKRMNWFLLFKVVALLSKILLTKPTGLRLKKMISKSKWMRPKLELGLKKTRLPVWRLNPQR